MVVGFERSPGLAGLARKNIGCEVIEGDFEIYDFSRLSVDAIILVGALVHLPHSKVPEVLNSITIALKDDGNILLALKKGAGNTSDSHGRVFYLWNDGELRDLFKDPGLDVIRNSINGRDKSGLPQAHCHELKGNRAGQLAVKLDKGFRMVFEVVNDPIPRKPDGGLDWSTVTAIRILELAEDYHD